MSYTFGYVSVVGLPNAGKSTLVNRLVGEKVAIVSSKKQTTRDNILGIVNGEDFQIVLIDTPGIHKTKYHLDKYMMKNVRTALSSADLVLYLVDLTKDFSQEEKEYISNLKDKGVKVLTVYTKSDLKPYKDELKEDEFVISVLKNYGVDKLLSTIIDYLPKSEIMNFEFERDDYTDKSMKFIASEAIRESALSELREEIPHGIAVEITRFEEKKELINIESDIICEKQSHKGIIIGKGGGTLKKIGTDARKSLEDIFHVKVFLKTFVRVEPNWRDNPNRLTEIGYK